MAVGGQGAHVSMLVASAVNSEGYREIMGICVGDKEEKSGGSAFLRHIVDHGLSDVHWIKIRTDNPPERIMKDIRRHTQVVGAFRGVPMIHTQVYENGSALHGANINP